MSFTCETINNWYDCSSWSEARISVITAGTIAAILLTYRREKKRRKEDHWALE